MVIAIVGHGYSRKAELARYIEQVKSFDAVRLRPIMAVDEEPLLYPDDTPIDEDDIFYKSSVHGTAYVFLERQFRSDRNLIYVVDTPNALGGLLEIGVVHTIVFVDSNQSDCMHRANPGYSEAESIRSRYHDTKRAMLGLKRSGNYSFYINVELINDDGGLRSVADKIVLSIQYWLGHRSSSDKRMPYISETGKKVPIGTSFYHV